MQLVVLASYPAHQKRKSARYTPFVHALNLPRMWGLETIWILPFYMTSVFGLDSIPVRIIIDAGILDWLTSTLRLHELQKSC